MTDILLVYCCKGVEGAEGDEENCRIDPLNLNKFGLFINFNGTVRNQRTVHTGKNDLRSV